LQPQITAVGRARSSIKAFPSIHQLGDVFKMLRAGWRPRQYLISDGLVEVLSSWEFRSETPTSAGLQLFLGVFLTAVFRFIWTKSARDILQKVIRAHSNLSSKQNATLH